MEQRMTRLMFQCLLIVTLCSSWFTITPTVGATQLLGWQPDVPPARQYHAMTASADTVFLFGGIAANGNRLLNDLWIWRNERWQWIGNDGPTPRRDTALAYDARRQELVLFGGWDGLSFLSDTWVWRDGTWQQLQPAQSPSPRRSHAMVYDTQRRQIVLFGGSNGQSLNDTWVWNGTIWIKLEPETQPLPRQSYAMTYDTTTDRVVLFGGKIVLGLNTRFLNDVWVWDGANWTRETSDPTPPARSDHILVTTSNGVLLFGGENEDDILADTWLWNGGTWQRLTPAVSPTARSGAAAAFSATHQHIFLFGGSGLFNTYADTWVWNGSNWRLFPDPTAPSSRMQAALADDIGRGTIVLFGGVNSAVLDDTWLWTAEQGWQMASPATRPSPRYGHAMAYDPLRNEVVLFGGYSGSSRNDTWVWNGSTWLLRNPPVSPPPRWGHTLTYDAARGRIVLFGGAQSTTGFYNDTWEWDGQTWIARAPTTQPAARRNHAATYDSARGRVVVFGGYAINGRTPIYFDDTWEWDGERWQRVAVSGPAGRMGHTLFYDAVRRETVLFGGIGSTSIDSTIWAWNGLSWTQRPDTLRPPTQAFHTAVYQLVSCRALILSRETEFQRLNTWQQRESSCSALPTARIDSVSPNPANRSTDRIQLIGSGNAASGSGRQIQAYRWLLNGTQLLGTSASLTVNASDFAVGVYEVSLAVRDDAGIWSLPVTQTLTIIDNPRLVVSTDPITVTLVSGDRTERTLTIANQGASPLLVNLRAESVSSFSSLPTASLSGESTSLTIPRPYRPNERLDARLTRFAQTTSNRQETYLVYMNEVADLRAAAQIQDWRERGRAVVQQLQEVATRSQADTLRYLDEQQRNGAVSFYWSLYSVNAIVVRGNAETLRTLLAQPRVVGITISEVYALNDVSQVPLPQSTTGVRWNIRRIGADRVWGEFGVRGEGVVVGSIDTGALLDHPLLNPTYRGRNPDGTYDHTYSWFDPTGSFPNAPGDDNGHGTHTIGTMVGIDGIGVAPGARWISARACSNRSCRDFDILRAMEWMLAPYPAAIGPTAANPDMRPQVVNNSWGGPGGRPLFQQMVAVWRAAGIFPAFAAGNCGQARPGCPISGSGSISSPGDYAESFATGATDSQDALAPFSSQGPSRLTSNVKPDLVAPGASIESAALNGGTIPQNGTSMASPHTAGAVALLLSLRPGLNVDQIETLLRTTARDLAAPGPDAQTGYGLLDVYAAAQAAQTGLGWLRLPQTSGVVQPGQTLSFPIQFDGRGMTMGTYRAELVIQSNDPTAAEIRIPVSLSIQRVLRQSHPFITHRTANSMVVRWMAPDGRIARLEYAEQEGGPWISQTGTSSTIPGETLIVLRHLKPETTYLLRLIAMDGSVEDNGGRFYRVTTAPALPFEMHDVNQPVQVYLPLVQR